MIVRPLCKELQEKAIKELNEDPKRIKDDINHIREWLKKQKHIKARTDDQYLLNFLRGCKFSLERTKEKLDMFYTLRTILPEFFSKRDPFSSEIQEVLRLGLMVPLLKTTSPDSPKYLIFRVGKFDPTKISLQTVFKVNLLINDIAVTEDDQLLVAGVNALVDMSGVNMTFMMNMSPGIAKKAMTCYQDGYPSRPKSVNFIGVPSFFESMFNIFKPFMSEKMLSRINVIKSNNMEELYSAIPKSVLPTEYGGEAGPIQELVDYWKHKVESYHAWFKEDETKYGTDESLRPGKPKTSSELFGIEGSFRKLDVD